MVNKTISLTEDMFNRLKDEENSSGLIEALLREHYNSIDLIADEDKLNKRIEELEQEESKEKTKSQTEIEKLKAIREQIKQKKQEEENKANLEKQKYPKTIENLKDFARDLFDVEESELQGIAELFHIERNIKGEYDTWFDWGKAKGLKFKEGVL